VSSDVIRSPYSAIVDSALTMARGQEVRVFAWYDNEWGYSCRLVDLIATMIEPIEAAPQKLPRTAVAVP
jgi:glyceraldehyde-3-phosphate dehydrogenase/erythrose-4-phosphate dehydrogenase